MSQSLMGFMVRRRDETGRTLISYDQESAAELVASTVSLALRAVRDRDSLAIIAASTHEIEPFNFDEDYYEAYQSFNWRIHVPIEVYQERLTTGGKATVDAFRQRIRDLGLPIVNEIEEIITIPHEDEPNVDWRTKALEYLSSGVSGEPNQMEANPGDQTDEGEPIRAMISYAHEGSMDRAVLRLAQRLRHDGIDCDLDQFHQFPPEGWEAWMDDTLRSSRWVIVVASPAYYKRATGDEAIEVGLGAIWEHGSIRREIFESGRRNVRFIPVGFGRDLRKYVPPVLRSSTYFDVSSESGYLDLLRLLSEQPAIVPEPIGEIPRLESESVETTSSRAVESSDYERDEALDVDFFKNLFFIPDSIGVFDLTIQPVRHIGNRVEQGDLPTLLSKMTASYAVKSNVPDVIPFGETAKIEGFNRGVQVKTLEPKWRRLEGIRLHTSGLYRIMRAFEEDFSEDGILREIDLVMWFEFFVERATLLLMLVRNVIQVVADGRNEEFDVRLSVSGLQNRRLIPFDLSPSIQSTMLLAGSHAGTERQLGLLLKARPNEFGSRAAAAAREFCSSIFWTYGVRGPHVETFIRGIQQRLLGKSEDLG